MSNSCKIWLQITKLWAGHVFAARSYFDLDLQGSNPNVACDTASQYGYHFCEIVLKKGLQITTLWAGQDFAARSCCDLDLQGSNPNVARDMSSQYGDHFCKIVLNLTSINKVLGQTLFCCKVMPWPWPSNPNIVCDTSSQYGHYFCEIIVKSNIK